jgi:hypothetical protein
MITGAAFLAVSTAAGTASAQLLLKGSDTLELVTKDVITSCGLTGAIEYIGGGSGTGQAAMSAGTQHVAPMSRQLNNAQCTTNSRQLMIGLDGIVVVAKNEAHTDPTTGACNDNIGDTTTPITMTGIPAQFVNCTSNTNCTALGTTCDTVRGFCVPGGTLGLCNITQGCSPDGTYTFDNGNGVGGDDWKDVLAQIYGGQNHTAAPQTVTDATEVNADNTAVCFTAAFVAAAGNPTCSATMACAAGTYCNAGTCGNLVPDTTKPRNCKRNTARIDCTNPVRGVLLASYGSIISTPNCSQATPECVKVKHAFRRDDLSGTTDAFQALVGLVAIAPFTTIRSTSTGGPEIADFAAVASPFCNAGTAALNKGFTDALDLDPYRRACSAGPAPDRFGLENVCEAWALPNNSDAGCYVAGGNPAVLSPNNYPQRDHSAVQGRGFLPAGVTETVTTLQADIQGNTTKPRCLGVVVPISIPTDVVNSNAWDTWRYQPATSGTCSAGARGFVSPLPRQMVCPDGLIKALAGNCKMAINTTAGLNAFDCTVDSPVPGGNVQDSRYYNLVPVDNLGHMQTSPNVLLDAYANPNFPALTGNGLRRFVRRFYAVHMIRPDSSGAPATIATGCKQTDDTSQIGCLVKASPCSLGYAGREAADPAGSVQFNNVALRLAGVQATQATIENLATAGTPVYPMARKLWFNSFQAPLPMTTTDLVGFEQPSLTNDELTLAVCMGLPKKCAVDADCMVAGNSPPCNTGTGRCFAGDGSQVDLAIGNHNFVKVPLTVPRLVLNASGGGCGL